MTAIDTQRPDPADRAVAVENAAGRGRFLIVCEHATNTIPAELDGLGLGADDLARHIAWDPGALEVARGIARALDAPLVYPLASRLVIDVNRAPGDPDSIRAESDGITITGNAGLDDAERQRRARRYYEPFHAAVATALAGRPAAAGAPAVISVHSFTPTYAGHARPWHVGIIHDTGTALADRLIAGLAADPALHVGRNEPYRPADRVYHTLSVHAESRGLECAMIEIRADLLAGAAQQAAWAGRITALLAPPGAIGTESQRVPPLCQES